MGTPEFAVPSLKILLEAGYNIVGVITAPDRKAGRGRKLAISPVKEYALNHNLNLLQPEKLKDEEFVSTLKSLKADLQIVVAFRMLPEVVWSMPPLGTLNLHASLLPQYRGAAPINHAIMNGEKKTGLTTFLIDNKIDTGKILMQEAVEIGDDENVGQLHDKMKVKGALLVLKTVERITKGEITPKNQTELIGQDLLIRPAPKILKTDCQINWNQSVDKVYNFIRGLSPYPGAQTRLETDNKKQIGIKIFKARKYYTDHQLLVGKIITDNKNTLKVVVNSGFIEIRELQLAGKKRMRSDKFLLGFKMPENAKVL